MDREPHLLFSSNFTSRAPLSRACLRFASAACKQNLRAIVQSSHDLSPCPHRNRSMELFSQLLSAVTGGGTPTPNDVRTHFSHLVHGAFDRLSHLSLRNTVGPDIHDANDMRHQTDHASHDADLPCNPFVPSSTGHSSPRVYVDLSLPPRQSRPRNQKPPSNPELRHPPVSKNKKSVDELRLVADYEYGKVNTALLGTRETANM